MTEDASPPDDTQEAERDDESSADATAVADPGEPVTVAPDDGESGESDDAASEPSASTDGMADAGDDALDAGDGEDTGDADDAGEQRVETDADAVGGDAGVDESATGGSGVDESGADGAEDDESGGDESAVAESADGVEGDEAPNGESADGDDAGPTSDLPPDVRKYDRFKKMDGAQYERVNEFLRDRTYITAREWAIARLCADFRTETGVEMTKIGENLPHLVPFMTDTYTPQAVNQARSAFEDKVRKAGATFLYGAMCDFFTADELDDLMYEVTEVAKFLLEVEGVDLAVEEELEAEERISSVMRDVRQSSDELRHEGVCCPECGHEFEAHEAEPGDAETHEAE